MAQERIVVAGSGTGGITVAARLRHSRPDAEIVVISPSEDHWYQPLWTLVGGGLAKLEETRRPTYQVLPDGVEWERARVTGFSPEENRVHTDGGRFDYDALVVSLGLEIRTDEVLGLDQALEHDPRVWTNYLSNFVTKGPQAIETFRGGSALFTFPRSPLKCGGAPQKIMWIAEETFRFNGVRGEANVEFVVPGDKIFGIPKYREVLDEIAEERDVHLVPHHHLIEVDHEAGRAVFENVEDGTEITKDYALLHVAPPSRAPRVIAESALGTAPLPDDTRTPGAKRRNLPQGTDRGFVEVDAATTQHVRYPNVFSLGDCSNLPTAKTGAAIRKQAPVLVENLCAALDGKPLAAHYDGYASCPLVMGHNSVMLAEFDYEGTPKESFPFDQAKPRYSMWLLKRHILPLMYWKGMLTGHA